MKVRDIVHLKSNYDSFWAKPVVKVKQIYILFSTFLGLLIMPEIGVGRELI